MKRKGFLRVDPFTRELFELSIVLPHNQWKVLELTILHLTKTLASKGMVMPILISLTSNPILVAVIIKRCIIEVLQQQPLQLAVQFVEVHILSL